jgi:hypothetical protein
MVHMSFTLLSTASMASLVNPGDLGNPETHFSRLYFEGREKNLATIRYAPPLI